MLKIRNSVVIIQINGGKKRVSQREKKLIKRGKLQDVVRDV